MYINLITIHELTTLFITDYNYPQNYDSTNDFYFKPLNYNKTNLSDSRLTGIY